MMTAEEIHTEWKGIRSDLGNLICHIEGKTEQLGDAEKSWQKGYKNGLNFGWEKAWAIHNDYTVGEMEDLFEVEYEAIADLDPEYAIRRLKEHDEKKQNEIRFGDEVEAWDLNSWVRIFDYVRKFPAIIPASEEAQE